MLLTFDEVPLGDTFILEVTDVVGFDGSPVLDFTGWAAWVTFKAAPTDPEPGLLQKTSAAGGVSFSGAKAIAEITAANSRASFTPGVWIHWDVQFRDSAGRIGTPKIGRIRFKQDITLSS